MKQIEIALTDLHAAIKLQKSQGGGSNSSGEATVSQPSISNAVYSAGQSVEKALESVNLNESTTNQTNKQQTTQSAPPAAAAQNANVMAFYLVDQVFDNSPAQLADLRVGDRIVTFGSVNHDNFSNPAMAEVTRASIGRGITVKVKRNENGTDKIVELLLIPQRWSGQGLLGCHLSPIQGNSI